MKVPAILAQNKKNGQFLKAVEKLQGFVEHLFNFLSCHLIIILINFRANLLKKQHDILECNYSDSEGMVELILIIVI